MAVNMLEAGISWLGSKLHAHASRLVSYTRGAGSVSVTAVQGKTEMNADDGNGPLILETTHRDFLIKAADLVIASVAIEPARGDKIRESVGAKVYVYEVRPLAGDQPWRWSDGFYGMYRIHTVLVGVE